MLNWKIWNKCIDKDIHCDSFCLCTYRNIDEKQYIIEEDMSDSSKLIYTFVLRFIKTLEYIEFNNNYTFQIDFTPFLSIINLDFRDYGIIYPNILWLIGIYRSKREFKTILEICNDPIMLMKSIMILPLFSYLFYNCYFRKCLLMIQYGYKYTTIDKKVIRQYKHNVKQKKYSSVLKKLFSYLKK